jgi:D-3-phosphoglycerate dehydrogenase / 2-oxoglutarate reductase
MKIMIADPAPLHPHALAVLRGVVDGDGAATIDHEASGATLDAAFSSHDVVWVKLAERITAARLPAQPRTRLLACNATGIDHIDLDACRERGIEVLSLKGETTFLRTVRATAELSWGLLLLLQRQLLAACDDVVSQGRFARDRFRGTELLGKTLGVLGVGRLGEAVCGYGKAFGMRVIGCDPRIDFPTDACEQVGMAELFHDSDVLSIHVDYSTANHHLIDEAVLRQMKKTAVIINTARGDIIDESALLSALHDGRLAGAAVDVLSGEPNIDGHHPMLMAARTLPQLIITPHIGGMTHESSAKTELFMAQRIAARWAALSPSALRPS